MCWLVGEEPPYSVHASVFGNGKSRRGGSEKWPAHAGGRTFSSDCASRENASVYRGSAIPHKALASTNLHIFDQRPQAVVEKRQENAGGISRLTSPVYQRRAPT